MSFVDSFQKLWNTWEMRWFLLFSFSLQCILILTASMRKRTSNKVWIALIWLAYLCADWSAYYAIGLIPSPRANACEYDKYSDLHAFWAPFLLLHIGGPTTIAAFSLEDNETWTRSVLHLLTQAGLTLFVIYRAIIPHYSNPLLVPTLLMFVAAYTRYLERVLALYYASMNKFRNSAFQDRPYGSDFESLRQIPSRNRLSEVQMVKDSYILFQSHKWVFGDLPIKFNHKLGSSKRYLLEVLTLEEAFKEMEIQMNLTYDIFYTKTWLIVETKVGNILHVVSLCSELVALVLWVLVDKEKYLPVDVRLTNTLLLGGIVVDVLSCFKIIFSDVMIPKLAKAKWVRDSYMLNRALSLKGHEFWSRWIMTSRWSGTIPQFNWINDFIIEDNHKFVNRVKRFVENNIIRLNRSIKLSDEVKRRVIKQIKDKFDSFSRFGVTLELSDLCYFMKKEYRWKEFDVILKNAQLVDGLLLCHLVTELLFKKDPNYKTDVSKQVSEYLVCHLLDENNLIVTQGLVKQIYFDKNSCEFISKIYHGEGIPTPNEIQETLMYFNLEESTPIKSRLILKFAHYIKDHLIELGIQNAMAFIEDMWLGLLCSTAMRCTGRAHLERLSNGGELLTIVWLLLTNAGLTTSMEFFDD